MRGPGAATVAAGAAALGKERRALPAAAAEADRVPPQSMPRGCGVRRSLLARFSPLELEARWKSTERRGEGRRVAAPSLQTLPSVSRAPGRGLCAERTSRPLGWTLNPSEASWRPDASQSTRKTPSDPEKDLLSSSQANTQAEKELK